jgi:UDP-GlcNAc:undecaprenyl-phosphate/decaprenyl-phosphate GlcNAc-1-phosphate transferase
VIVSLSYSSALPFAAGLSAFALMPLVTPFVMRLAWRRGWVAKPRADRWSRQPTALMGGIAIFACATVGLLLDVVAFRSSAMLTWVAAAVMFVLGFVDDRRSVMPRPKLVTELACALVLLALGIRVGASLPAWISAPLTCVWVIGITNALNLLDNMDGLAAGVAAIVLSGLGVVLVVLGDNAGAATALATAGACAGFLLFNFSPARIFMGDCGSLFIGFTIAATSLRAHGAVAADVGPGAAWAALAFPLLACAVLVGDTSLVTISRLRAGRPVSQGGRDHVSHRLVRMGLSESSAVLWIYAVATLCGLGAVAVALGAWRFGVPLAGAGVTAVAGGVAWLLRMNVYAEVPATRVHGSARLHGERAAYVPNGASAGLSTEARVAERQVANVREA